MAEGVVEPCGAGAPLPEPADPAEGPAGSHPASTTIPTTATAANTARINISPTGAANRMNQRKIIGPPIWESARRPSCPRTSETLLPKPGRSGWPRRLPRGFDRRNYLGWIGEPQDARPWVAFPTAAGGSPCSPAMARIFWSPGQCPLCWLPVAPRGGAVSQRKSVICQRNMPERERYLAASESTFKLHA